MTGPAQHSCNKHAVVVVSGRGHSYSVRRRASLQDTLLTNMAAPPAARSKKKELHGKKNSDKMDCSAHTHTHTLSCESLHLAFLPVLSPVLSRVCSSSSCFQSLSLVYASPSAWLTAGLPRDGGPSVAAAETCRVCVFCFPTKDILIKSRGL